MKLDELRDAARKGVVVVPKPPSLSVFCEGVLDTLRLQSWQKNFIDDMVNYQVPFRIKVKWTTPPEHFRCRTTITGIV